MANGGLVTNRQESSRGEMKHIDYFDGLKGLSALIVFFCHFFLGFLEEIFNGQALHLPEKITLFLYRSPLLIFFDGKFMVSVFCTLSALFVCLKALYTSPDKEIIVIFPKRYCRVVLPLIPMSICIYLLSEFHGFYNKKCASITCSSWLSQFYSNTLSLSDVIRRLFLRVPFFDDRVVNPVFWMIPTIVLGSIISIIVGICYNKSSYFGYVILLILFVLFFYLDSLYLCSVIGSFLAILYSKNKEKMSTKFVRLLSYIFLVVGLFLGGWSIGAEYYSVYYFFGRSLSFWHINNLGAAFLVVGIMCSPLAQKVLNAKPFLFLGKISFSIYIIHLPVICSVSSFCFVYMFDLGIGYLQAVFITFLISIIIIVVLSYFYYKLIEVKCNKLIRRLFKTEHFCNSKTSID